MKASLALWCAVMLAAASALGGCSAFRTKTAVAVHSALDVVTDTVDPLYGMTVEVCDAREGAIIEREGSSAAQDATDIDTIRAQCDDVVNAFEAVREAQGAARNAADAVIADSGRSAFAALLSAIDHVRAAASRIKELIRDGWLAEHIRALRARRGDNE